MKKICYLSQINKNRLLFRTYTFKDKLNSYNNLVADLIVKHEDFIGNIDENGKIEKEVLAKIKEAQKTINFEVTNNRISIPSPYTKKFLKIASAKPFVIMIGINKAGERLNCLIQQANGRVKSCKYDHLIESLKKEINVDGEQVKINFIANMFIRNSKELVLLNGSLDMPIIEIGESINNPELTRDRELKVIEKKAPKEERKIIKIMRENGHGEWVDKYNLINPNYPETTLMFYETLFKSGKENIVGEMLTTQDFTIPQLKEIALGIQSAVGITKYADPLIDAEEMSKIRKGLENNEIPNDAIAHNKIIKKLMKKKEYDKVDKVLIALANNRKQKEGIR